MAAGLLPGRLALTNWPYPVDGPLVPTIDWDNFDPESLFRELRDGLGGPDGEKMIWAFEQALGVARIDPDLLNHLLAAAACLLAHAHGESPRAVLAAFARRSISDREWSERYAVLFSAG